MKRRHHLEWHRFRNNGSHVWRRRRHRSKDVGVRVTGTVGSASATLVDLLDGRFVQNPSLVESTGRSLDLPKVVVELTGNTGHDMLKPGQLVLEVLQGVMENVDLGVLLSNQFTKVATLTDS